MDKAKQTQDITLVIAAAEADLQTLRAWLSLDFDPDLIEQVGARIVTVGHAIRSYAMEKRQ